ncbi:MAG: diaminopimelate epimerase [Planctomycetota bacterium]|jgi:diaminopimelate epimerase
MTTALPLAAWTARGLCISGAGNRFYLIDARGQALPLDAAEHAQAACETELGFIPDGLLWVMDGARAGHLRMVIHNADGTRPEACGNALMCMVHWAVQEGVLTGAAALIETDGGERDVCWEGAGDSLRVEVCLGRPTSLPALELADLPGAPTFARVELANPHAVLCLDSLDDASLDELGPRLQQEVAGGINMQFVTRAGDGLEIRVWERGVGPTEACGTGSAASAWTAVERWGLAWPVAVSQPGGTLTIDCDEAGQLWLTGPVETQGHVAFTGGTWATCSTF